MGLFSFLKRTDINEGLKTFRETDGAVLIDVRTKEEYSERKIEGSTPTPHKEVFL